MDIPILPLTQIHRGNILTIVGTRTHTDTVVQAVGYADRPTEAMDTLWVGLAILLGVFSGF